MYWAIRFEDKRSNQINKNGNWVNNGRVMGDKFSRKSARIMIPRKVFQLPGVINFVDERFLYPVHKDLDER